MKLSVRDMAVFGECSMFVTKFFISSSVNMAPALAPKMGLECGSLAVGAAFTLAQFRLLKNEKAIKHAVEIEMIFLKLSNFITKPAF